MSVTSENWSAKDCARRLGIDYATLKRWRRRNVGPPFIQLGRRIFYRPEAVSQWLNEK